jgi:hypothetical protein
MMDVITAGCRRAFGRVFLFGVALLLGALLAFQARSAEAIKSAVSAAAESSHVFCDATGASPVHKAPCFLRSLYVTTGAVAGYVMTFNAVSAPADGAVTPVECIAAPANSTVSLDFGETTEQYVTGLTAVFSSTGCFTKTASATAFFKLRAQ